MGRTEIPFLPNSFGITFACLFLIVVSRYFIFSGTAYLVCNKIMRERWSRRRIEAPFPKARIIRREILWSIGTSAIFALTGALLIEFWKNGYTKIYNDPAQYGWFYFFGSIFLMAFLHDTYFYFTHRLMHRPVLFKIMHRVHHDSRLPTAFAAFSFHPWESVVEAIILPALVLVIPIHYAAFLIFLMIMTVLGVVNHLGYELFPSNFRKGKITRWLISATHHQMHHKLVRVNYGLYFTFWDRLLKTHEKTYDL